MHSTEINLQRKHVRLRRYGWMDVERGGEK